MGKTFHFVPLSSIIHYFFEFCNSFLKKNLMNLKKIFNINEIFYLFIKDKQKKSPKALFYTNYSSVYFLKYSGNSFSENDVHISPSQMFPEELFERTNTP